MAIVIIVKDIDGEKQWLIYTDQKNYDCLPNNELTDDVPTRFLQNTQKKFPIEF